MGPAIILGMESRATGTSLNLSSDQIGFAFSHSFVEGVGAGECWFIDGLIQD